MNIESLSLFLDIFILTGLAAAIFFAFRLTRSLENFKRHRLDFEKIMRHLNDNIERAQKSMEHMKGVTSDFDDEAHVSLHEARELLEELKLMNQSGNNLADRLEYLASQSRYATQASGVAQHVDDHDGEEGALEEEYDERLYNNLAALEREFDDVDDEENPGFAIHDPDFAKHGKADAQSAPQSQAERELLQALQRNKRAAG